MADNCIYCLCLNREILKVSFSFKVNYKKFYLRKNQSALSLYIIQPECDRAQRRKVRGKEERNVKQDIILEGKKKSFRISGTHKLFWSGFLIDWR